MALFDRTPPTPPAPDPRDALIEELRQDKARLIEENLQLRNSLIAMADAKAYYMMNPKGMRATLAAKQASTDADPATPSAPTAPPPTSSFPTNNPADYRSHLWKPGQSFSDIEKAFKQAAAAEVARITSGSGDVP